MFPPFPGFEELPIHFDVEWQGRVHSVVTRIEQLPTSPPLAIPICSFRDAPEQGEWLLVNSLHHIYIFAVPSNIVKTRRIFQGIGQPWGERIEFSLKRVHKFQRLVERALNREGVLDSNRQGVRFVRVVQLPDVSCLPRIALLSSLCGIWCDAWKFSVTTPFQTPGFDVFGNGADAQQWIQAGWNDPDSQARFSWEWANWRDEERLRRCGIKSDLKELERVMTCVLTCSQKLWEVGTHWNWTLHPKFAARGYVTNYSYSGSHLALSLSQWQEVLFAHFAPDWHADWLEQHECVRAFWKSHSIAEVSMTSPPTMHEQLEARPHLRDWLQQNAPDRMDLLPS